MSSSKKKNQDTMNVGQILKRLVENAFDFLNKAISEIDKQPKFSVIHFYAAVELFLKARLMNEHWSLVITKKEEPNWNKFINGDFRSVTLGEAAARLEKIVRSGLSKPEKKAFEDIAKLRNRMVHFYHVPHTKEDSDKFRHGIIKQQLKAWYFLHQLLTVQWKNEFSSWEDDIAKLDSSLRQLHEFLQVVFYNIKPEMESQKSEGVRFEKCPSCEFESQENDDSNSSIYSARCLVCGFVEHCLNIECPDCGARITFRREGLATCHTCGRPFDPEQVADIVSDSGEKGNCTYCNGYHTVVPADNDEWICTQCFEVFESIEYCEWCHELNTGDMENSYLEGCNYCEGMLKYNGVY